MHLDEILRYFHDKESFKMIIMIFKTIFIGIITQKSHYLIAVCFY